MNIIHIIFSMKTGGTETMLIDIINYQSICNNVSLIIINNEIDSEILETISSKVNVYKLFRSPSSKNIIPLIKLNALLLVLFPRIIHFHNHNGINTIFSSFRKKSVLTVHCIGTRVHNFGKYKKIFAISNSVAKDIGNRSKYYAHVVYNGVNLPKIKFNSSINKGTIINIVQVSRLDHLNKGQHLLIEALKILVDRNCYNIRIDFIGDGNSFNYLKNLVKKYSLTEYITFYGLKNRNYIYNNLQKYDLLIQPSFNEGFGLTIAEAMAAKIPVLVSNLEGPMEVIGNGEYGYYFEAGNVEMLANRIQEILTLHDSDLGSMIEKGYNFVKLNFNVQNTANKYLSSYEV